MNFNPNFPTSFDILHVGLATAVIIQMFLLLLLLTIIVAGLVKRFTKPQLESDIAAKAAVETKPNPVVETPKPAPTPAKKPTPAATVLKKTAPDSALQLLGLLQQEARFIDFVKENVASYSDSEIGAAARVVHEGCSKVINSHFKLEPVQPERENSRITLKKGFDPSRVRMTGNIVGEAPFSGTLVHRGWQATKVTLPNISVGHNIDIIATAEVEL